MMNAILINGIVYSTDKVRRIKINSTAMDWNSETGSHVEVPAVVMELDGGDKFWTGLTTETGKALRWWFIEADRDAYSHRPSTTIDIVAEYRSAMIDESAKQSNEQFGL